VIHFEANVPQKLLEIRYGGVVRPEETESGLDELRARLAALASGFRRLVDISGLRSMDVKCAPFVEKAMDLCNASGASMVVRVIPDPHLDIGMSIMSVFHYGGGVKIYTCKSPAEADDILSAV